MPALADQDIERGGKASAVLQLVSNSDVPFLHDTSSFLSLFLDVFLLCLWIALMAVPIGSAAYVNLIIWCFLLTISRVIALTGAGTCGLFGETPWMKLSAYEAEAKEKQERGEKPSDNVSSEVCSYVERMIAATVISFITVVCSHEESCTTTPKDVQDRTNTKTEHITVVTFKHKYDFTDMLESEDQTTITAVELRKLITKAKRDNVGFCKFNTKLVISPDSDTTEIFDNWSEFLLLVNKGRDRYVIICIIGWVYNASMRREVHTILIRMEMRYPHSLFFVRVYLVPTSKLFSVSSDTNQYPRNTPCTQLC